MVSPQQRCAQRPPAMLPMIVREMIVWKMIVREESALLASDYSIRLVPPLALDLNVDIH
jgi:hypothetical protein